MYKLFFKRLLQNPKHAGDIAPFSQSVVGQLSKHLDLRSDDMPWRILEVGAGVGSITRSIVPQMKANDQLDVIEIDRECCKLLKDRYKDDKRISIHCASILDWKPDYKYDFIISTLPMNSFSAEYVDQILTRYQQMGTREACCTYVEYIGLEKLSLAFANKEKRDAITNRRKLIKSYLRRHLLEKNKVFTNFLPCYVYHLKLHPTLSPR